MPGSTGPKNQRRPTRNRASFGAPLAAPVISHPGVSVDDYADLVPAEFAGQSITITVGPTVKTNTKGVPRQLFHEEPS